MQSRDPSTSPAATFPPLRALSLGRIKKEVNSSML